ncbi:AAA family ATPase [Candidatus Saccharibacteria bacterium]|nr:AAA family ATPase [Candidatus Saccharibacteria bacterium]
MLKITSIRIKNFRTFVDSGEIPVHDGVTILIGENGSGKTSVLHALDIFLNNRSTLLLNGSRIDNTVVPNLNEPTSFFIKFQSVGVENDDEFLKDYFEGDALTIECCINNIESPVLKYFIHHKVYEDDTFNKYRTFSAKELADLVISLGLPKGKKITENICRVEKYIKDNQSSMTKIDGKEEVKFKDLKDSLPILEIYSSENYDSPINLVKNTLENTYRQKFYTTTDDGAQTLKLEYANLRMEIQSDLDLKVNEELKNKLSEHMGLIDSVDSVCDIDFLKSLQFNDIIISRNGKKTSISNLPQGEKNNAQLAIMEWSKNKTADSNIPIIRCYDEPDANLDYMAQKKKLNIIKNSINDKSQAIICTHSLMLINSAPASSINKLNIKDGETSVEFLSGDGDEEIESFLKQVAEISGLSNISLFYEKAYIVFEGQSEAASLSKLFYTYTGSYFADFGVVPINLETNGQWKNALKFLGAKRKNLIVMLLDNDSIDESSGCNINRSSLEESGFDDNFLQNNCFFIGSKEFEDTYTDTQLVKMANQFFPKQSGDEWKEEDFIPIRNGKKFSEDLRFLLCKEAKQNVTKPTIAGNMANILTKNDIANNAVLRKCFDKIIEISVQ